MISLKWNADMCVGIKDIDAEHKKILSTVAAIIETIDTNCNTEIIKKHFSDLEVHTSAHFKQEEALMQTMNYSAFIEHQQTHQEFLDKLPELQKQLFDSNNAEAEEQVSQFLYDWVIEHILISDMDYVQAYHSEAKPKLSLKRLFQGSSEMLSRRVSIATRMLITAALPIIGILILSFIAIKDNYKLYKNMQFLDNLTQIVQQVNSLTHSLQIERGLLSSHINSDFKRFSKALAAKQSKTNNEIANFSALLNSNMALLTEPKLAGYVSSITINLEDLIHFRKQLIIKQATSDQVLVDYSAIIENLLSQGNHLPLIEVDAQFANNLTTINTIIRLKEILGQQRDVGILLIDGKLSGDEQIHSKYYNQLLMLSGMQLNTILDFNRSATAAQKQACANLCDINEHRVFVYDSIANFMLQSKSQQNSQRWFIQLSNRVDDIKIITDTLIHNLEVKTTSKLDKLERRFYLVLILISTIIVFSTLLFTVLFHSVITPIRRITNALKQVTLGRYNQQIDDCSSNDEIGAMYDAYETLRRKLLQADMSESIIKRQQQSLLDRRQERDKYRELASKDTLTGALNRRKFNLILKQEIGFAKHDKQKLSLMLLDIDHFKAINDNYGHAGGDQVLRDFYDVCFNSVKSSDIVARIGGEEFAILMPETSKQQAQSIAERLRHNISELTVEYGQEKINLTVSIGLAQWHQADSFNSGEFIAHTDKLLYKAKNNGRNCVVLDDKL